MNALTTCDECGDSVKAEEAVRSDDTVYCVSCAPQNVRIRVVSWLDARQDLYDMIRRHAPAGHLMDDQRLVEWLEEHLRKTT